MRYRLSSFFFLQISRSWSYPPLNDSAEVAPRIRKGIAERGRTIGWYTTIIVGLSCLVSQWHYSCHSVTILTLSLSHTHIFNFLARRQKKILCSMCLMCMILQCRGGPCWTVRRKGRDAPLTCVEVLLLTTCFVLYIVCFGFLYSKSFGKNCRLKIHLAKLLWLACSYALC